MTEPVAEQARLVVIANPHPGLQTVQEHVLELPELCPSTHNPGPGSTLSLLYTAGAWFLELYALEAYLAGFVAHPVVRDNELLAQTVALEATGVLGVPVEVSLDLKVVGLNQFQRVRVRAGCSRVCRVLCRVPRMPGPVTENGT